MEVFDHIMEFYNLMKNQFNKNVRIFRSDNGTEFINQKFELSLLTATYLINMLPTAVLSGSTSSRKDFKDTQYATDTGVSEVIHDTSLNNDEYDPQGEDIEYFGQLFESLEPAVGQIVRRYSRKSFMPSKYDDYVLNKNVKYGIDKVANYSHLSIEKFVFTTSLNKIHEPSTYAEVVKDIR
ncbi:hypothetical protein Tco_1560798 [Tanacetum coccineum]